MAQDLVSSSLFPTAADLALLSGASLFANHIARVSRISSALPFSANYRFVAGSTSTDGNQSQLVIVPGTSPGSGKWLRCDPAFDLILPVTFATADNANLCTVPAELTLLPIYAAPFLETSIAWSGGTLSTIGLSFTNTTTARVKGSVSGGAAGGIGGTYVNFFQQTLGSGFAIVGTVQAMVFYPGTTLNHDRIVSAYSAGAGNWHVPVFSTVTTITPASAP